VIYICEQLQLKQFDGTAPLLADIQSNPISVEVTYDRYYNTSSYSTWTLTVPASGIVTLTVPASTAKRSIVMMVVTLSLLFCTLNIFY